MNKILFVFNAYVSAYLYKAFGVYILRVLMYFNNFLMKLFHSLVI